MKIAIISDIHDNLHNLVLALKIIKEKKIKQILFLGDFIAPGGVKILARCGIPVFALFGNNDGEKYTIVKTSLEKRSNLTMSDKTYDFFELDGKKIFLTHYPPLAKPMAKSGDFDAVFYGHNHEKNEEQIGKCLIANPGEVSASKTGIATFGIYNTKDNSIEIIKIPNAISLKTKEVDDYRKDINFEYSKTKSHKY